MKVFDLEGNEFNKEAVDAKECIKELGWSTEKPEPKKAPEPELTAAQLKEKLTAAGIDFKSNASKADLLELVATIPV